MFVACVYYSSLSVFSSPRLGMRKYIYVHGYYHTCIHIRCAPHSRQRAVVPCLRQV
jgi:hypothetical protein